MIFLLHFPAQQDLPKEILVPFFLEDAPLVAEIFKESLPHIIKILCPEKSEKNIKITEKSGILMKYPSSTLYDDKDFLNLQKNYLFELILRCIDSIYYEDQVFDAKNYKKEELSEFLENLDIKSFEQIQNFLLNSPKIYHKIEYKNSLGNDRTIEYSSLNDFFMWR